MPDMPNGYNEKEANQAVIIDYRTLPGGPYVRYSEGRTLTHELGHYFGLLHVFGAGSCDSAVGYDGILGERAALGDWGEGRRGAEGWACMGRA